MSVRYTSHKKEALAKIEAAIPKALEIVGGTAERHVKEITPVDTGRLRNSIAHAMVGNNATAVGTSVEYAIYVEFGTYKMSAQPYLRPGIENHANEYAMIIKNIISM